MRVPFTFDLHDGIQTVTGTVRLDGDVLVFETATKLLQIVPLGAQTVRLPADDVEDIRVETTRFRTRRLVVRPYGFVRVEGFPGDPVGEIVLPITRGSVPTAEAFVQEVRLRNLPR